MATYDEIERTYGFMEAYWRLSAGAHADITGAFYDGDYRKTLEQAQADKHEYILSKVRFVPGVRVLDIGCGWGGLLLTVKQRGGTGVGLTLSGVQQRSCLAAGVDARLLDWKEADPGGLGPFDAVVSIGAMEAFCSMEEHLAGRQDDVYRRFFACCHAMLRPRGWMFLQTMLWGRRVPTPEDFDLTAPRGSDRYILGALQRFFPGSWPPSDLTQIARTAAPYFAIESTSNGRADYIRTMDEWSVRLKRPSIRKLLAVARMLPHFLRDRDFGLRLEALWYDYNKQVFQRGLMTHERIVLQRLD